MRPWLMKNNKKVEAYLVELRKYQNTKNYTHKHEALLNFGSLKTSVFLYIFAL